MCSITIRLRTEEKKRYLATSSMVSLMTIGKTYIALGERAGERENASLLQPIVVWHIAITRDRQMVATMQYEQKTKDGGNVEFTYLTWEHPPPCRQWPLIT